MIKAEKEMEFETLLKATKQKWNIVMLGKIWTKVNWQLIEIEIRIKKNVIKIGHKYLCCPSNLGYDFPNPTLVASQL